MGELDRAGEYKRKKPNLTLGQENNALMALFTLNAIFFILLFLLQISFSFSQAQNFYESEIVQWFKLPAELTTLSERPWTLLTYMFSDTGANIWRALSNMMWLWAFGYVLQQMAGNDKIIPIYLYGGIFGGIVFIASYHLIPSINPGISYASLMGANAATVAVASATTTLNPRFRFFQQIRGGVAIWILLAIYLIIDLIGIAGMNAAYSLSHIGGAIAGFGFIYFYRKGYDGSVWINSLYFKMMTAFNPKKPTKKNIKNTNFYNPGKVVPFTKKPVISQERVDEILDKINQYGAHFLTQEEVDYLKKASEENLD